jgi:hypothetical protein
MKKYLITITNSSKHTEFKELHITQQKSPNIVVAKYEFKSVHLHKLNSLKFEIDDIEEFLRNSKVHLGLTLI